MARELTKLQAVFEIAAQASRKTNTRASLARMMRAARALGLSDAERHTVLRGFEYIDASTGEVHERYRPRPRLKR
jgi:hypothetical protein